MNKYKYHKALYVPNFGISWKIDGAQKQWYDWGYDQGIDGFHMSFGGEACVDGHTAGTRDRQLIQLLKGEVNDTDNTGRTRTGYS